MNQLTSYVVKVPEEELNGFCKGYELRRHLYEYEANAGCYECRRDWVEHVGPTEIFGSCNPLNGNFLAVVLPLCKPERLRSLGYAYEYAFLFDNKIEFDAPSNKNELTSLPKSEAKASIMKLESGYEWLQAKTMRQIGAIDKEGTERIVSSYEEWSRHALTFKGARFDCIDEYVKFRVVDCAAIWVEATMLWGMGITLTKEEDELLQPIKYSCFAALGLNNDYYSFDREMEESKDLDFAPVNSVHLHLVWHNVNVEAAKVMVKDVICHYEEEFLDRCETFRRTHAPISRKLDQYLKALSYMIIGNNVWSINCPRYHKAFRYNADDMEEKIMKQDLAILEKHGLKPLARTFSSP